MRLTCVSTVRVLISADCPHTASRMWRARQQTADVAQQEQREFVVLLRHRHHRAVESDQAVAAIHAQPPVFEHAFVRARARPRAPRERVDAREEFELAQGLDHVVVGAARQRVHDILLALARGDEQHRHGLVDVGSDPDQHFRARHPRHFPVEKKHVEGFALRRAQQVFAQCVRMATVAGDLQPGAHQVRLILFVFKQCDAHDDQFKSDG